MTSSSTLAPVAAEWMRPARMARSERNFWFAAMLTVAVVAVFWGVFQFERNVFQHHPRSSRFVGEPSEAAMRYVTIPHIMIGFLFLVTSRANRTPAKRAWIAGLLIVGALLCSAYYRAGGRTSQLFYTSIYLYFLVHELRDQAMFYRVLGDAPPSMDRRWFDRFVLALIALVVTGVAAIGWTFIPLGWIRAAGSLYNPGLSSAAKVSLALAPFALWCGAAALAFAYFGRGTAGGAWGLVQTHASLIRLMIGVACVLGVSLLVTQRAYSLIVFHVAGWYIFACYQTSRHPPAAPPAGWWTWMRTTTTGFRTLHLGMIAALMVVGGVWVFGFGKPPALNWLLLEDSFLYWTIMHITVSFVPR